jgi:hypothetical protein
MFFELNSLNLVHLTKKFKIFLIIVNGYQIQCNLSFSLCLSRNIYHAFQQYSNLKQISFNSSELDSILIDLFKVLQGNTINFNDYPIKKNYQLFPFNLFHF